MGECRKRVQLSGFLLTALVVTLASEACRAPTEARVTVSTSGACSQLGDIAIVATADPETSESRIAGGFYAAQTRQCDGANTVGSIVVTPGGSRAAVVVITPAPGQSLASCIPPDYKGCIVARRAFAFIDNTTLDIPITLEDACRNVPCDAVTTCKKGLCLSSDVTCQGSNCRLQGELPDGGIEPDAEVFVDGSSHLDGSSNEAGPDAGGRDAGRESGADSGPMDAGADGGDAGGSPGVTCSSSIPPTLFCGPGNVCGAGQACCENIMAQDTLQCQATSLSPCQGLAKGRRRYCCSVTDCVAFPDTPNCNAVLPTSGVCTP